MNTQNLNTKTRNRETESQVALPVDIWQVGGPVGEARLDNQVEGTIGTMNPSTTFGNSSTPSLDTR